MLDQVMAQLARGEWPGGQGLRQWLRLALVKKMGVLNQPYHCWSSDRKINPPGGDLLLAALLLDDRKAV